MPNEYEKIGALWLNQDRRGVSYLSGTIKAYTPEGHTVELSITIFPNHEREHSKQPDYLVFRKQEKHEREPF